MELLCHRKTAAIIETDKKPSDFHIGEIYKMNVASRSHVKKPYYVVIINIGNDFIKTYIPERHALEIRYPSFEWNYHINRMQLIGTFENDWKLLYDQKILTSEMPQPIIDGWEKRF